MLSIILSARERFGFTRESVLSILADLSPSIPVIFVAGKAPKETLDFLAQVSKKRKKFILLKEDRYLRTNEARNLGLKKIPRKSDVVFMENDVIAKKGWLDWMLKCAKETGADVVTPLIFEGTLEDEDPPFHIAGSHFVRGGPEGTGPLLDLDNILNHKRYDWRKLRRNQIDVIESHCFFTRRKLLDRINLDDRFEGLYSHLDFSLEAEKHGAKIMAEPNAHVLFANPALAPITSRLDFEFFAHRWSEANCLASTKAFAEKWGLDPSKNLPWNFYRWSLSNKAAVFASLGVLTLPERLLWLVARFKACPEWIRERLEDFFTARIRTGMGWK